MAEMMSEAELAEIRAVEAAAAPGPWEPNVWIETEGAEWRATGPGHDDGDDNYSSEPGCPDEQAAQRDAAFIAASRTAVPRLLDLVERLQRTVKFLRYYEIPDDAIRTLTDELTAKAAGTPLEAWAEDAATNIDQLRRERDEWRSVADAMRPVVEAAAHWRDHGDNDELDEAVDAYRKAAP